MWVSSISPPKLSLIIPLTSEIQYRTEQKLETHTDTQTETDTLPIQDIGSSKNHLKRIEDAQPDPTDCSPCMQQTTESDDTPLLTPQAPNCIEWTELRINLCL